MDLKPPRDGRTAALAVSPAACAPEGLRERKRRQTRQRIAETGLGLFLAQGYEATTLDAIAQAAGISRRTFFAYFKSKEDVVTCWQEGAWADMREDLRRSSPTQSPLLAVRDMFLRHIARYTSAQTVAIDRLMRSSETLIARKTAFLLQQEQAIFEVMCELWPREPDRQVLGMVAMMSIGALRLSIDAWQQGASQRPMAAQVNEAFDALVRACELRPAS